MQRCQQSPRLPLAQHWSRGLSFGGGNHYLSAEELPNQGGSHLLHKEAIHAAGSVHEATRVTAPGPTVRWAQYGRVAVVTMASEPVRAPPLPWEPADWEGGREGEEHPSRAVSQCRRQQPRIAQEPIPALDLGLTLVLGQITAEII